MVQKIKIIADELNLAHVDMAHVDLAHVDMALNDVNYDDKIMRKIARHLKKFDQETTKSKKEKEYLQNFAYKTSNFCGLPKIHKSQAVKEAIRQQLKFDIH